MQLLTLSVLALAPVITPPVTEEVKLTTEDKQVLVADLYRPKKSKEIAPAAILVHDAGGSRADLAGLAERLTKQGFAVLVPDLRGHGDSVAEGAVAWADMDDDTKRTTWAFAMRDLRAGADFLRKDDAIHASNLSMLGYMAGSTLAARHAVRDENVRCVVLLGPKAEELGFKLQNDLEDLGGLPTYIGAIKETKDDAEVMAVAASSANGGLDFVEVAVFKALVANPVKDKRMPADIAKWMMDQAVPKKGD